MSGWKGGTKSGITFERELDASFKNIGEACYYANANSTVAQCDKRATYGGLSFLIEQKKTNSDNKSLSLSVVSRDQKEYLSRHERAGGISLLAVKCIYPGSKPSRCWVGRWSEILVYCESNKRLSIPLVDDKIPPFMFELSRVERPNSLGKCWDMSMVFSRYWNDWFHEKMGELGL